MEEGGNVVPFDSDRGVPMLIPILGVSSPWVVTATPAMGLPVPYVELPFTPGVGVNSPGGWFANAAKAADVGSIKTDGVREGVNRNGSAGAPLGVGSRSSWPGNLHYTQQTLATGPCNQLQIVCDILSHWETWKSPTSHSPPHDSATCLG